MEQIIFSPISLDELESRLNSRIQESIQNFLAVAISQNQSKQQEDILTFKEGCKFLSIATATGYGKVSRREIPFIKKGKFVYFSKQQLTEWLHSGQRKTVEQLEVEAEKYTSKRLRK